MAEATPPPLARDTPSRRDLRFGPAEAAPTPLARDMPSRRDLWFPAKVPKCTTDRRIRGTSLTPEGLACTTDRRIRGTSLTPEGLAFCVSAVRRTFPHPDPTCSRHTIATFASRKRFRKRESRYRARQHDVDSGRHAERLKQIPTLGRKNPPLDCSTITTAYNDTPERAEIVDVTANDTAE